MELGRFWLLLLLFLLLLLRLVQRRPLDLAGRRLASPLSTSTRLPSLLVLRGSLWHLLFLLSLGWRWLALLLWMLLLWLNFPSNGHQIVHVGRSRWGRRGLIGGGRGHFSDPRRVQEEIGGALHRRAPAGQAPLL